MATGRKRWGGCGGCLIEKAFAIKSLVNLKHFLHLPIVTISIRNLVIKFWLTNKSKSKWFECRFWDFIKKSRENRLSFWNRMEICFVCVKIQEKGKKKHSTDIFKSVGREGFRLTKLKIESRRKLEGASRLSSLSKAPSKFNVYNWFWLFIMLTHRKFFSNSSVLCSTKGLTWL